MGACGWIFYVLIHGCADASHFLADGLYLNGGKSASGTIVIVAPPFKAGSSPIGAFAGEGF